MFASFADDNAGSHKYRDVKITLIFPATEAHIRKVSNFVMLLKIIPLS